MERKPNGLLLFVLGTSSWPLGRGGISSRDRPSRFREANAFGGS